MHRHTGTVSHPRVCTHRHKHKHTHARARAHTHSLTHTCTHLWTLTHAHLHTRTRIFTHARPRTRARTHPRTHTHANKQTNRHTLTRASLARRQVRKRRRRRLALRPVRPPCARRVATQRYATRGAGYTLGPHRRPEVKVVCAAFALGNANSNVCPSRYERLDSEAACKSAAASGGMAYGGAFSSGQGLLPQGCYRVTFGSAAIFNPQSFGSFFPFWAGDNYAQPLCAGAPRGLQPTAVVTAHRAIHATGFASQQYSVRVLVSLIVPVCACV
jgi:hypothetical protein